MKAVRQNGCCVCLSLLMAACAIGCTDDVYNPNRDKEKEQFPPEESYFSFNTRAEANLYVNYNYPGHESLIEVYSENPVTTVDNVRTKRSDLQPLFKAFTDLKGVFQGTIYLPTGIDKIYLYTREIGLPECVELTKEEGCFTFDVTALPQVEEGSASTRTYTFSGSAPYALGTTGLYALFQWPSKVYYTSGRRQYSTNGEGRLNSTDYTIQSEVKGEDIASFTSRLKTILWDKQSSKPSDLNNSGLVSDEVEKTNFYLAVPTQVDLMFLHERAGYRNTFGYYYYKGYGDIDPSSLKKYVIFPNVSIVGDDPYTSSRNTPAILTSGMQVRLKFFGENGDEAAQDTFPEGYTIGWFMIPNGFNSSNQELQNLDEMLTSNDPVGQRGFISVYDEALKGVIVGAEDGGDNSYEDLLFCVFTEQMDAIIDPANPGRPTIKEGSSEITIPEELSMSGTLAFEDVWPTGGDYDMNDVIVEYEQRITFDKSNIVQKIVDVFRPVHNGASYHNAFAYQLDESQRGTVTLPDGAGYESATNSIIVFDDIQKVTMGHEYVITRTFEGTAQFDKALLKAYNPYIIVHYEAGAGNRVEVHLPKHLSTTLADKSLNYTESDAYFIDKNGKYPFAIDLPVTGFQPVTETKRIDDSNEYPGFRTWTESMGTASQDWYNHYKGQ